MKSPKALDVESSAQSSLRKSETVNDAFELRQCASGQHEQRVLCERDKAVFVPFAVQQD